NAHNIPSPARGRGWATSGVRELVLRDLYRGRLVWGKTRRIRRSGTRAMRRMPPSEWLVREDPALRVVSEDLWRAAHLRLDRTRAEYRRMTGGKLVGRAPDARSPYLLSALIECGVCHGPMHATKRTGRRAQPRHYYVCTTHRVRGDRFCANRLSAPMEDLDGAVVEALRRDVLAEDLVVDVVHRALELRRGTSATAPATRAQIETALRKVEGELRRYAEAIATAGPLPALLEAVRTRERRREDLQEQLAHAAVKAPSRARAAADFQAALVARL